MNIRKGALTAKAKAAGMTIDEFCAQKDLSLKEKKECILDKNFKKFKKK